MIVRIKVLLPRVSPTPQNQIHLAHLLSTRQNNFPTPACFSGTSESKYQGCVFLRHLTIKVPLPPVSLTPQNKCPSSEYSELNPLFRVRLQLVRIKVPLPCILWYLRINVSLPCGSSNPQNLFCCVFFQDLRINVSLPRVSPNPQSHIPHPRVPPTRQNKSTTSLYFSDYWVSKSHARVFTRLVRSKVSLPWFADSSESKSHYRVFSRYFRVKLPRPRFAPTSESQSTMPTYYTDSSIS
jgi:hypothetical protein